MSSDKKENVPRREFLRFAAVLSGTTAAGIYLATDARLKAHQPLAPVPQPPLGNHQTMYSYLE